MKREKLFGNVNCYSEYDVRDRDSLLADDLLLVADVWALADCRVPLTTVPLGNTLDYSVVSGTIVPGRP